MHSRSGWRLGFFAAIGVAACGGTVSHLPSDMASGAAGTKTTGGSVARGGASLVNEGGETVDVSDGGSSQTGKAGSSQGGRGGSGVQIPTFGGDMGLPMGGTGGLGGNGCPGNQIKANGECMCPPYVPTFCSAAMKCVNTLKDVEACGACSIHCAATSACTMGKCTPEPTEVSTPMSGCGQLELQMAPGVLYVLASKTGKLSSIALASGALTLLASGLIAGSAFALDATNAYVAAATTVTQVNLATGVKTVLVTEIDGIFDVAVDNGKIYYTSGKGIKQADATAPSTGTLVAQSADEGVAQGVAVSGGMVLYLSNDSFNVESDPIVGDMHVKIGASQGSLIFGHRSVQADATNVYWANGSVNRSLFAGLDHPVNTVAVPIDGSSVVAYAVDPVAKTAYIATMDGSLEKSTFDSQDEATWVARGLSTVTSVVLDDTSVYVANKCVVLKAAR